MNINKEIVKQHLAQGRVKEVIDFLLKNTDNGYVKNNLILQANKYEKYRHNQLNNLVSKQELDIDSSNIVLSLIKIIDSIEEEKPVATELKSKPPIKTKYLFKLIGWAVIIGVAWFGYWKIFPSNPFANVEISQSLRETNQGDNSSEKENKYEIIKGKWKSMNSNETLSGSAVTEYFDDNIFWQTGNFSSNEPKINCEFKATGKYYIADTLISFIYEDYQISNCSPKSYEKELEKFLSKDKMQTGANKLVLLNENTMIQEDDKKERSTFIKIIER